LKPGKKKKVTFSLYLISKFKEIFLNLENPSQKKNNNFRIAEYTLFSGRRKVCCVCVNICWIFSMNKIIRKEKPLLNQEVKFG